MGALQRRPTTSSLLTFCATRGDICEFSSHRVFFFHTKDPTPVSAENISLYNSLGKKRAIAQGKSFESNLKKRAAQGK